MPHSHHSHSGQFCRHAKDSLEEVIQEAIRKGFEVFGLSEHAPRWRVEDLFPEEADLLPSDLLSTYLSFLNLAQSLRRKYEDQISLLISLETDYITPLDLSHLTEILHEHEEIDYIVGSVHHVNGISIDFDKKTWKRSIQACLLGIEGRTMNPGPPPFLELSDNPSSASSPSNSPSDSEKTENDDGDHIPNTADLIPFLENYFDAQYDLINHHKPEIIGHFDLCLLWIPNFKIKDIPCVWERVERNIKKVVEYGGLFEANSAAIRKGWKGSYPSEDVLKLILSLSGKICLSDDSHGVSYVGLNYIKMKNYLVEQGVKEIWYLVPVAKRQDGDEDVGDRRRIVSRRLENWVEHPFWSHLEKIQ
ncbi:uncharacterized protein IL334_000992 [Kwoniella shivajii]|uniref:Histidinol-phosphatase n=1 Tax=Kwoniella shivajii TaxID=564305 RepID=A0ABZ1CRS3_9TREE|nr:hypothetical protein IL334_000992 [Kwoniella shivajii]